MVTGSAPSGGYRKALSTVAGTPADRLVVAVMPGNAGGAKGPAHLWLVRTSNRDRKALGGDG